MGKTVSSGGASVEIGGELEGYIRRISDGAMGAVIDRMEAEARKIKEDAESRWPRGEDGPGGRRGRYRNPRRVNGKSSADLFSVETRVMPDAAEARVTNPAPYLYRIRSEQNGLDGKLAFNRLIRTPGRKAGKGLAEDMADEIRKLAEGG